VLYRITRRQAAGAIGVTALLMLYPRAPMKLIVGSDIVHAVPMTLLAGMGHSWLGSVDWPVLAWLLSGSIPGIILGSYLSAHIPDAVLRPMLVEPTFHSSSHGFRPTRGAHTAIAEAKGYLEAGYQTVVDFDLAKFFDHVHHQRLLARVAGWCFRRTDRGVGERSVLRQASRRHKGRNRARMQRAGYNSNGNH
jgi:hypothetical protein